ncbi:hypothetical protein [Defluviimonas salinarum]|uniref:DUF4439 domain-containing protein n=1 Tax=Defluviimonas salinarum TaxID=2992147 RepID=A0ABT3J9D9_9RHOB|nr:hypothetical protein [Defluviimonas salinarum]MCW3784304.1 hypothetical protein [Defluviimonas salinarum]
MSLTPRSRIGLWALTLTGSAAALAMAAWAAGGDVRELDLQRAGHGATVEYQLTYASGAYDGLAAGGIALTDRQSAVRLEVEKQLAGLATADEARESFKESLRSLAGIDARAGLVTAEDVTRMAEAMLSSDRGLRGRVDGLMVQLTDAGLSRESASLSVIGVLAGVLQGHGAAESFIKASAKSMGLPPEVTGILRMASQAIYADVAQIRVDSGFVGSRAELLHASAPSATAPIGFGDPLATVLEAFSAPAADEGDEYAPGPG